MTKMRSHNDADSTLQKGVASWGTDEVRWCSGVMRVESAYSAGINRQTPSWAPLSSPAFLDLFAILFVIQPFEATWDLSVFFHNWIMFSSARYSLPEFPQSVSRQISLLCKEDKWKSTFLLQSISGAFLGGRKYTLFFEQRTDYLKSDRGRQR